MTRLFSLFFSLFMFFSSFGQKNYKEWLELTNKNYKSWSENQNWQHNYFQWINKSDSIYNTWLKNNDWEIDNSDKFSFTDSVSFDNFNKIKDSVNRLSDSLSTTLSEISKLQNRIIQLQKENNQSSDYNINLITKLQTEIAELKKKNQNSGIQTDIVLPKIKIWAVIVGISEYKKKESKLRYCDDDAYKIYGFLRSIEGGAIPDKQIKLLIDEDASGLKIKHALSDFSLNAGEEDILLFYYSGHGSANNLLAMDYSETRDGLISHKFINNQLSNSKAKFTYCILDACHSGNIMSSLGNSKSVADMEASTEFYSSLTNFNRGNVFIVSSKGKEVSMEVSGKRQGVFSYYFIEALKGKADYNKDFIISITEAFNFTRENVLKYTNNRQTPLISGKYLHTMPLSFVRK